jgi:hypothetical protein
VPKLSASSGECGLHPLLQRKLISYLKNKTVNQYFIATHSASFIDTPDAAIFHVSNDGVQTDIKESILRRERFAICVDHGTRASDIVQSNAVIWVEGPSDRVYVQHWIEAVAPELQEGIHYSIMFYGGRLLSHLSADDDDVKEFIGLRSLNQNLAILIDSDKSSQNDTLNQTKLRLLTEFKRGPSVAWITAGREIENYIHHGVLQEAVKTVHSEKYGRAGSGGIHDHSLYYRRKDDDKIEKIMDKVKVAKIVCRQPADLSKLDLHERIQDVANMIRQANV